MTRRRLFAAPLAPLAALLLAACAASPAQAPPASAMAMADAPSIAAEPSPGDLEGQIAALGAAEARLDRSLGRPPGGAVTGAAAKDLKKEEQERATPPSAPRRAPFEGEQKASPLGKNDLAGADPCATACSALSSMERAAKHLCDLTGDSDARCDSARSRVAGATERVGASCPACGGAR